MGAIPDRGRGRGGTIARRAALCLPLLVAGAARAHDYRFGAIAIGHPWAPAVQTDAAMSGTLHGAVYFAIVNRGPVPERLIGARAAVARAVHLIEPDADGRPAAVAAFELAPGRPVALRPGGRHLRLEGLDRLDRGTSFALALRFERAGVFEVSVAVEDAAGH